MGLVGEDARLVHGVQDAAVHRLQAVAHVRKGARGDDAHRVLDERLLHLSAELGKLELGRGDVLYTRLKLLVFLLFGFLFTRLVGSIGIVLFTRRRILLGARHEAAQVLRQAHTLVHVVRIVSHAIAFLYVVLIVGNQSPAEHSNPGSASR